MLKAVEQARLYGAEAVERARRNGVDVAPRFGQESARGP